MNGLGAPSDNLECEEFLPMMKSKLKYEQVCVFCFNSFAVTITVYYLTMLFYKEGKNFS